RAVSHPRQQDEVESRGPAAEGGRGPQSDQPLDHLPESGRLGVLLRSGGRRMRDEKIIYRIRHGSHLYGTNTETSDHDYKEVFVPSGRDILLGRIKEGRQSGPDKSQTPGAKNQPGDIDR